MRPSPDNRPAVFLDRDGTLIEDRGWLRDPRDVIFYPQTMPALRQLAADFVLFIVTNQRGVADGLLGMADVERVNAHVVTTLRAAGIPMVDVYCCPHRRDENCACIKPKPFFLEKAARDYGIDLARSFVVGDHPHDVKLAANAGATGVYVLTGHGAKHRAELAVPGIIAADIGEAAEQILQTVSAAHFVG
jgi:histidinol-phosphate phosphatase family protein